MAENAPSGNSGANQGEALLAILDDITRQVQHARAVPMSASAMVNRAELLDLVAAAREAVPDQVAAADRIVAEAEGVRSHAVHEGEEIVAQAHAKAADLVAEHAIVGEAKGAPRRSSPPPRRRPRACVPTPTATPTSGSPRWSPTSTPR